MSPFTVWTIAAFAIGTPERYLHLLAPLAPSPSPAKHSTAFPGNDRWSCQRVVPFSNRSPFRPTSSERIEGCSTIYQVDAHGEGSNCKGASRSKIKSLFLNLDFFSRIKRHHIDESIGTAKDVTRATRISRVGSVVVLGSGFYHVVSQDRRGVVSGLVIVESPVDFRPNLAAVLVPEVKGAGGVECDQVNRPGLYSLLEFFSDEILALCIVNGHLHVFGDDPKFVGCGSACVKEFLHAVVDVVFGILQAEVHHPHFSLRSHERGFSFCLREIPDGVSFAQVPSEVQKKPGFTGFFRFAEDEAGVLPC